MERKKFAALCPPNVIESDDLPVMKTVWREEVIRNGFVPIEGGDIEAKTAKPVFEDKDYTVGWLFGEVFAPDRRGLYVCQFCKMDIEWTDLINRWVDQIQNPAREFCPDNPPTGYHVPDLTGEQNE